MRILRAKHHGTVQQQLNVVGKTGGGRPSLLFRDVCATFGPRAHTQSQSVAYHSHQRHAPSAVHA